MTMPQSDAMRELTDPGWREREAMRAEVFARFFNELPRRNAVLGAAIITNKTNTSATAEPIAVVDFYADEKESRC